MAETVRARESGGAAPGSASPVTRRDFAASNLAGGIWLLFLIFPIVGAWNLESRLLGVVTIVLIVAFAAIYLLGLARSDTYNSREKTHTPPIFYGVFAVEALLAIAILLVLREEGLGVIIFLIPIAIFLFEWPFGLILGAIVVALVFLSPLLFGAELGYITYGFIAVAVYTSCMLSEFFTQRSVQEREISSRLAVLDERERVGRDVHDVLGHTLTLISVKSELAEQLLDIDQEAARREIREISELSRKSIIEVRQTVAGLRVRQLGDEFEHVKDSLRRADLELTATGDPDDVDPRHRIIFAWVLREAVTNVIRHAHASRVCVEFSTDAIAITDDGCGIAPAASEGNGLSGLRNRVEEADGELTLESSPAGTRLVARINPTFTDEGSQR